MMIKVKSCDIVFHLLLHSPPQQNIKGVLGKASEAGGLVAKKR